MKYFLVLFIGIGLGFGAMPASATSVSSDPVPIVGTPGDDILTGTSGADIMIGLEGDDLYYVDNRLDVVIEQPDEGFDTIVLTYCFWISTNNWFYPEVYSFPTNVEKLVMGYDAYDVAVLESDVAVRIHGDPLDWRDRLDDNQFDNASNLVNTCTMASIANVMTMLGSPTTEEEVLAYMLANHLVNSPSKGDTDPANVQIALEDGYGCTVTRTTVRPQAEVAAILENGHAIILGVDYGVVNENADPRGTDDHAIVLTGVAYHQDSGALEGFFYCDSGDEHNPSGALFMSTGLYYAAHAQYPNAQILVIDYPLKVQFDSFHVNTEAATGDVMVIGNSGDNVIVTGHGNDYIEGGAGDDILRDEGGGDDVFVPGKGNDTIFSFQGSDAFVFSTGDGFDKLLDTDTEKDLIVFDPSVEVGSIAFASDGADLFIHYGSNDTIQVIQYAGNESYGIVTASGQGIDYVAFSNLVNQMAAYCTSNGVDFSDIGEVRADSGLTAMMAGSWQLHDEPISYRVWAAMLGVPHVQQGYAAAPANDGIGNLLKYAAGLPPLEFCGPAELFTFTSNLVEQRFKMQFRKSKRARANLVAEWKTPLSNTWDGAGIDAVLISETATNETWEASVPLGQNGFMRLRAELPE